MAAKFQKFALKEPPRRARERYGEKPACCKDTQGNVTLSEDEIHFIEARDSFYVATVCEKGLPDIEHWSGPAGFLCPLSPTMLAFADYGDVRPWFSTGNLPSSDRVALFLIDYPHGISLKILGRARSEDAREHPDLVKQLTQPEIQGKVEQLLFIEVVLFEWNSTQTITPRYTVEEMRDVIFDLQERLADLNFQLKTEIEHESTPPTSTF